MSVANSIIAFLNKPGTRGLLKKLIYMRYKQRGKKIEAVNYLEKSNSWEFRIGGTSYLSSGPGWIYDYDYLLEQLKKLSGYAYLPKQGDVVIDIGAGVGEETVIFSSLVGPEGNVFAVEAHPKTHEALQYMVRVNSLKNVICSNIALSEDKGTVSIEDTDNSLGNSILDVAKGKVFTIPAETFDDFVERNNIQKIDFIKMNVEGAEQLIIKGMTKSLPKIKNVAISCHDFRYQHGESEFFKTKEIIVSFLTRNNFKVSTQATSTAMVDDYVYGHNSNLS